MTINAVAKREQVILGDQQTVLGLTQFHRRGKLRRETFGRRVISVKLCNT